ncbi:Regulatory protein TetR [uncultured Mycobacterium sp.]|uniref:Regulatory protein TetR n=1 Tax=uncultured Mycobacterium sp. TaxID=171292 RepID=A0A1Y5PHI1_9MYCO|nr:Regulatory protein TetR [uncultured Mycobacterium sp.]
MTSADSRGGPRRAAIMQAALEVFASRGSADATFQIIAQTAGVSVGAIQHHFGSKERLIDAVDTHVIQTIAAVMSQPEPAQPVEVGQRVRVLFEAHLPVLDYLARQLVDDGPVGRAVFDAMAAAGVQRWEHLAETGATPEGLDTEWAGLNPLVLVLGAIILRRHLDRRWPEGFATANQLSRWEEAMNVLISKGQLKH